MSVSGVIGDNANMEFHQYNYFFPPVPEWILKTLSQFSWHLSHSETQSEEEMCI